MKKEHKDNKKQIKANKNKNKTKAKAKTETQNTSKKRGALDNSYLSYLSVVLDDASTRRHHRL